jgi:uncharacterized protein YgbK (DUF1537 family)
VTSPSLLIVADDLTGACDTAGAVVAVAGPVSVHLSRRAADVARLAGGAGVIAVDLDSRSSPVAEAVERTIAAVSVASGDAYLKIDSTLRGHVVATVAAAVGAFRALHPRARVVVCPAFPARGRLVAGRRIIVDGRTLDGVALDEVAALPGVEVADAATDADLAALARNAGEVPTLWVGSAGLAPHVVAALVPRSAPAADPPRARIVTVVVGSEQPASAGGAAALDGRADTRLRVVHGDPRRPAFVDAAAAAAHGADAIVVTGGYTARRLLERLDVDRLQISGEMEPGIPWARSAGPVPTIVTKAGGFGDVHTLGRLVDRLLEGVGSA